MRRFSNRRSERGQILVVFVLALVAIVAAVGLVIDGGFAYAQRRTEQNAADLAALAGSDALLNGKDATAAAQASAQLNGYQNGTGGVVVNVTLTSTTVKVDLVAPHSNYFAGVVGQGTWQVSVTATAVAGIGTRFLGVAPFVLSQEAFDANGLPYAVYANSASPIDFSKTQGSGSDAPLTVLNLAWTNLGTGNVSSSDVKNALDGSTPINASLILNQYVGQHNNGVQNSNFDTNSPSQPSINTTLSGLDVAVPIVGPPIAGQSYCYTAAGVSDGTNVVGCFRGWALFHVVSATKLSGSSDGIVTGYFVTGITRSASVDSVCAVSDVACQGLFHGSYVVKLIN